MELKKSYKGFWLFLLGWLAAVFGCVWLPIEDADLLGRIVLNLCCLGIAFLSWLILRTGQVYWYNGVTFEAAAAAGPERCRAYARKHFRVFGRFGLAFLLFTVGAQLLRIPFYNDIYICVVGMVIAAASTIRFKL